MSRNRNADSQQLMSVVLAHKRSCRLSLTDTFRISHRHIASTYLSRTHVASLTDTHHISFRNKCVYRREVLQCFHIPEAISWVALSVAIQTSSGWSNRSWWSMSHCKPAIFKSSSSCCSRCTRTSSSRFSKRAFSSAASPGGKTSEPCQDKRPK